MLQNIHQRRAAPRASSIYCRWMRENRKEGTRLVAAWIDSQMRCFGREVARASELEMQQQDALEGPGGAGTFRTEEHWIIVAI
jgi:hypothetical protein